MLKLFKYVQGKHGSQLTKFNMFHVQGNIRLGAVEIQMHTLPLKRLFKKQTYTSSEFSMEKSKN